MSNFTEEFMGKFDWQIGVFLADTGAKSLFSPVAGHQLSTERMNNGRMRIRCLITENIDFYKNVLRLIPELMSKLGYTVQINDINQSQFWFIFQPKREEKKNDKK